MSAPTQFHSFNRLPAKLRIIIWQEFSLPEIPYVHIVDHLPRSFYKFKLTTYPRITPTQILELVAVAGVSREARDEVLDGREIVYYEHLLESAAYFEDGPHNLVYEAQIPICCVRWDRDLIYLTHIPEHTHLAETLEHFKFFPLQRTQNLAFDVTEHVRYRPDLDPTDDRESHNILRLLFLDPAFKDDLPELRQLVYAIPRGCTGLGSFRRDPENYDLLEWNELDLSDLDRVPEDEREWGFFQLDKDWLRAMTNNPIRGRTYLILDERTLHFAKVLHQTFQDGKTEAGFSITVVMDHRDIWDFGQSWLQLHRAEESNTEYRGLLDVWCMKGNNTGSSDYD